MKNILRPALVLFALLSVLTGLLYPLVVTGAAQAVFPQQAAGGLVQRNGRFEPEGGLAALLPAVVPAP